MQFTFAACLTALVALASAQTPANTAQPPSGNPIGHPELGELLPAGQSFTITWAPDTGDRITLLLLEGPSTNVIPILTIAQNIPNTGSYTWPSVPTNLKPGPTGYGIQLIVEGTGQYQFSPQCGLRNDAFAGTATTIITTSTASTSSGSDGSASTATLTSTSTSTSPVPTSTSTTAISFITYASGIPSASGAASANFSVPVLSPTRSMSVPSTLQSTFSNTAGTRSASATTGAVPPPSATGGAGSNLQVGVGSGVGLAMAMAMLAVLGF